MESQQGRCIISKPKAPKAPDPIQTGAMQTGTNVGTAIANQVGGMVNQVTPYGNLNYNQTGSYTYTDPTSGKSYQLPQFTATQSLTPAGQSIQNATMQTQQNLANMARDQSARVGSLLSKPMDMSGVAARKAVPTLSMVSAADELKREFADSGQITKDYDTNYENDRQRVEAAMTQRMQPQMQQSRAALEDRLRQQGLTVGSAGWDRAMASQGQVENDARIATVLAGGQEQSRLVDIAAQRAGFQNAAQSQQYGQDLGRASFWNQGAQGDFTNQVTRVGMNNASQMDMWRAQEAARAASLAEAYQQRNQPINEISALMSGSQVQAPSFMNTPGLNMPTTDYAGLINQNYANQMGAYNQQMGQWNGLWGGLMGGASNIGAAAMLSDRRAKTDIRRIGTADNGLPIFTYRYKSGGPMQAGVMAQDVLEVNPAAVVDMGDGFLGVNYAEAFA